MATTTGHTTGQLEELVSKMELHEKLSMLAGKNLWETVPVDRLQIPSLKVRSRVYEFIKTDALHIRRCSLQIILRR